MGKVWHHDFLVDAYEDLGLIKPFSLIVRTQTHYLNDDCSNWDARTSRITRTISTNDGRRLVFMLKTR
jgi:hypothetical protein